MNINLKTIVGDELRFKANNVRIAPNTPLEIKPAFARHIRRPVEQKELIIVTLELKIESTPEEVKPFDIFVRLNGVFEADVTDDIQMREFNRTATAIMFPYLRSVVSNLTANAFMAPLMLPVLRDGILFPEDRDDLGDDMKN